MDAIRVRVDDRELKRLLAEFPKEAKKAYTLALNDTAMDAWYVCRQKLPSWVIVRDEKWTMGAAPNFTPGSSGKRNPPRDGALRVAFARPNQQTPTAEVRVVGDLMAKLLNEGGTREDHKPGGALPWFPVPGKGRATPQARSTVSTWPRNLLRRRDEQTGGRAFFKVTTSAGTGIYRKVGKVRPLKRHSDAGKKTMRIFTRQRYPIELVWWQPADKKMDVQVKGLPKVPETVARVVAERWVPNCAMALEYAVRVASEKAASS